MHCRRCVSSRAAAGHHSGRPAVLLVPLQRGGSLVAHGEGNVACRAAQLVAGQAGGTRSQEPGRAEQQPPAAVVAGGGLAGPDDSGLPASSSLARAEERLRLERIYRHSLSTSGGSSSAPDDGRGGDVGSSDWAAAGGCGAAGAGSSSSLASSSSGPVTVLRVSLEEKPQATRNKDKAPDYYANVGDAIRTLREDIPMLFSRDLNYCIYRDDITFRDPRNTFTGMKNYQTIFWSLRFHGSIFFSRLFVEVKRIWQPEDTVIKMRWTVHGIPRVPWEAEGTFDGISTYKLDSEGKIYEHAVDNVLFRDPPLAMNQALLYGLNLAPSGGQQAIPGMFCPEPRAMASSSSCSGSMPSSSSGTATASAGTAALAASSPVSAAASSTHTGSAAAPAGPGSHLAAGAVAVAAGAGAGGSVAEDGSDLWVYLQLFSWFRMYLAYRTTAQLLQVKELTLSGAQS